MEGVENGGGGMGCPRCGNERCMLRRNEEVNTRGWWWWLGETGWLVGWLVWGLKRKRKRWVRRSLRRSSCWWLVKVVVVVKVKKGWKGVTGWLKQPPYDA
ncbi:hypothetical protein M0802_005932 [Mischocyttarus mexicanus]|nr:hypothetical protein M0802_005932 [Mischocyttarus mexicanus]